MRSPKAATTFKEGKKDSDSSLEAESATNKKRPRDFGNDDDDDDVEELQLLGELGNEDDADDDLFVSQEERARSQAELRRELRRQRLAQIQQQEEEEEEEQQGEGHRQQEHRPLEESKQLQQQSSVKEAPASKKDSTVENRMGKSDRDNPIDDDAYDDDDGFDMFSSSVSPVVEGPATASASATSTAKTSAQLHQHHHQEDCDDAEGYYKATIGEVIELESCYRLKVLGVIGKGVFSTVLKCHVENNNYTENTTGSTGDTQQQQQQVVLPEVVALKCIRHNETMAKSALQEIQFLQQLSDSPGIMPMLLPQKKQTLYYRGHVVLVMGYCEYNLRTVLQKFGRGVGLSLTAVQSYFAQLLSALNHLKTKGILHADIKPDNILVSADYERVQLGDFGSAFTLSEQSPIPTPYMVSRFYRAPEIILGITPLTHGIDLWSLAVSIAELFTGTVLFRGRTNNEMIQVFQQILRMVFPNRIIRQHLRECEKYSQIQTHFIQQGTILLFQQQTIDPVTKQSFSKHVHLQQLLDKTLSLQELLHKAAGKQRGNVGQLSDLLHKCLALDPAKRIDIRSALKHEFFRHPDNNSSSKGNGNSKK